MADQPQWNGAPAIGRILAEMAKLYARAVRVDLERRKQAAARVITMFNKDTR